MKAALANKPALFQFGAAFLLHSRKSFFHSGKNASTASTHNGNFPITKAQFIASLQNVVDTARENHYSTETPAQKIQPLIDSSAATV